MTREVVLGFVGCSGVGKTSLLLQWLQGHYVQDPQPTVESIYKVAYALSDDVQVPLTAIDTSGQEVLAVLRDRVLSECNAFVLVYDISDRTSFDATEDLHEHITELAHEAGTTSALHCFLVGTKADVSPPQRAVSTSEGQAMADALGCPFAEVSAKDSVATTHAFDTFFALIALDHQLDGGAGSDATSPQTSRESPSSGRDDDAAADAKRTHKKRKKCVMF